VTDLARLGAHDVPRAQVLGDYAWLSQHGGAFDAFALGIGTPADRLRVAAEVSARFPDVPWPALVHPSAIFDRESAALGRGVLVCANVVGTVNLVLEDFALVNLACTLGHEARIGEGAVLNPTVNISGGVVVHRGVLVGTGAQVLQYLEVGAGATVGAGAVVSKSVPPGVTVVGIPAKPLVR
jgi:sugar O-acyltransferase (sialic acid O-acetyltransferase NeuD family)